MNLNSTTSKIKPGDKFERLTVTKFIGRQKGPGTRGVYPVFECQCSCGTIKNIFSYNLTRKHVKSCGCLNKELLKKGQAKIKEKNLSKRLLPFPENYLLSYYKVNAQRRGLDFQINHDTFKSLIYLPCYYCGRSGLSTIRRHGSTFAFNGLDRVDNTKGYLETNVRTCCKFCNRMKGTLSERDFWLNVSAINSHSLGCKTFLSKVELEEWRLSIKKQGKSLVVCSGCFDVFHNGHSTYLKEAGKFGDVLLVGLNSDSSVRQLKGESRPINKEKDRLSVISSLRQVGAAFIYDNTTEFLKSVSPDIWVKGSDYTLDSLNQEELKAVTENGGSVQFIPLVDGLSTTSILSKI
jgi:rfaE bifunctional protein nucleotidyltransferase chain/domain